MWTNAPVLKRCEGRGISLRVTFEELYREMRILFLTPNFEHEGTFHRAFHLARALASLGHEPGIIAISSTHPQFRVDKLCREGVRIIRMPTLSRRKDYIAYLLRPLLASARCWGYDLVHAFTLAEPMTSLPAHLLACTGANLFIDWDDRYGEGGLAEQKPFQPILKHFTAFLEKRGTKIGQGLTVVSSQLQNQAVNWGFPKERILRLGNGTNCDRFPQRDPSKVRKELGLPLEVPVVVYMGNYNKALPLAMEAFRNVLRDFPSAVLMIVGEISIGHDHLGESKQDIQQAEKSDNYLFCGRQPPEKVPLFLSAADVAVLPMEDNIAERSRFPIRLGEFMAAGLPVVAHDIGEVGRVLKETGSGMVANNPSEFQACLHSLLADPKKREAMGETGRRAARTTFSWSALGKVLHDFYERILDSSC